MGFPGLHLSLHAWQKPPLAQGTIPHPIFNKNLSNTRETERCVRGHRGLQGAPQGLLVQGLHSLARPFTMSRAYRLRSSVTEASRLEIAKGTESIGRQFQVLVPVLPSTPFNAPSLVSRGDKPAFHLDKATKS